MRLVLNETELLAKALNDGCVDNQKPSNTIRVLIKHYLSNGINKKQTYKLINKFLTNNYRQYNPVDWYKMIKGIINEIHKNKDYQLFDIEPIKITKNEINRIKKLNDIRLEKLAFTLLVYAKIYNQINKNDSNWVNEHHRHIFSDAKIAITKDEQGKMMYKLKKKNYIEVSVIVDCTNIKINYVDNNSETIITIKDFRNFIYEYFRYFNPDKYIQCAKCNKLITPTNNRQKYCEVCWKEKHKEQDREYQKRKYNNSRLLENPRNPCK